MKLFLFAIGARDRASSRLRVWDHADWLHDQGHDVVVDSLTPPAKGLTRLALLLRIAMRYPRWVARFFASDAIMVQESLSLWPLLYFRNFGKRRRVLFDFSDPVDRHGKGLKGALRRFAFRRMVALSDTVMVENPRYLEALKPLARDRRHFFGPVDARRYGEARREFGFPAPEGRPLRFGWTGSPSTFPFVKPLLEPLDRIAETVPIEIVLMGVSQVDFEPRHAALTLVEWSEAAEYATIPTFDLGLFRLEPTEDARWRGAGKLFIYLSAGVPFVASDYGIARDTMAMAKNGFPVDDDDNWAEALESAVAASATFAARGDKALVYASQNLSYETYRAQLIEILAGGTE